MPYNKSDNIDVFRIFFMVNSLRSEVDVVLFCDFLKSLLVSYFADFSYLLMSSLLNPRIRYASILYNQCITTIIDYIKITNNKYTDNK